MPPAQQDRPDLIHIEQSLWIVTAPTGMGVYDFAIDHFFECRRPWQPPVGITAISRMGAAEDYPSRYREFQSSGITLIHSPDQYLRTSHLPHWYPLIRDLTPDSVWFDQPPSLEQVKDHFPHWPIFMKGERQTSGHQRSLSILQSPEDFHRAMEAYRHDPILHWQRIVLREYVPLRLVGPESSHTIPPAFEFRSFWWRGQCVGIGRYWTGFDYVMTAAEREGAMEVAGEAARRVNVPFLVLDLAQRRDNGRWIIIECNDGQDSGYAGVARLILWRHILDIERQIA